MNEARDKGVPIGASVDISKSIHRRNAFDFACVMCVWLVAFTLVKVLITSFSSPIYGYGNNWDFVRQSSCIGLWQSYPDKDKTTANPKAPVNSLKYDGEKQLRLCVRSADNVFPMLALLIHEKGDHVDFREIAFWKVTSLIFVLILLLHFFKTSKQSLTVGLTFFLVFSDLVNLAYINTLYTEFSVLVAGFCSMLVIVKYCTTKGKPSNYFFCFSVFCIIWLGFSKQQYMPLALFLGALLSILLLWRWRGWVSSISVLVVVLAIPLISQEINAVKKSDIVRAISHANATDTFLWAVLPEARDQDKALAILGLPASCRAGIGKSWYDGGVQENHPCPSVLNLSRIKLIGLFVLDPSTFAVPVWKTLKLMQPLYHPDLGYLEDTKMAETFEYKFLYFSSLSSVLSRLTPNNFAILSLVCMGLGLIFFGLTIIKLAVGKLADSVPSVLLGVGGITITYSICSSVFGDGYADVPKHGVMFIVGVSFQLAAIMIFLQGYLLGRGRV